VVRAHIDIHREALKERQQLPAAVLAEFAVVEEAIRISPFAPGFVRKREAGWKRRIILVAEARHLSTAYRMAWEVVSAADAYIWAYGAHQSFYEHLDRRARR